MLCVCPELFYCMQIYINIGMKCCCWTSHCVSCDWDKLIPCIKRAWTTTFLIQCGMVCGMIMTGLEGMDWVVMAYFQLSESTEENHEHLRMASLPLFFPNYETVVPATQLWHVVIICCKISTFCIAIYTFDKDEAFIFHKRKMLVVKSAHDLKISEGLKTYGIYRNSPAERH